MSAPARPGVKPKSRLTRLILNAIIGALGVDYAKEFVLTSEYLDLYTEDQLLGLAKEAKANAFHARRARLETDAHRRDAQARAQGLRAERLPEGRTGESMSLSRHQHPLERQESPWTPLRPHSGVC
jgi:hypothetical protein